MIMKTIPIVKITVSDKKNLLGGV